MSRPLIAALAGALVLLAALLLAVMADREDDAPSVPVAREETAPAPEVVPPTPEATREPSGPATAEPPPTTVQDEPLPSFDVVRIDPLGNAVLAGRAEPEAEVIISDGDRELGRVTADRRGEWVFLPDRPLDPGTRELTLRSRAGEDAPERRSDGSVVMVVPEPGDSAQPPLAVATAPNRPSRVLQAPVTPDARSLPPTADTAPGQVAAPGTVVIDVVDYDEAGNLSFGGRAAPGTDVLGYIDNRFVGRATSGSDGRWGITVDEPVAPGRHSVRADALAPDTERDVAARAEIPFQRPETLDLPEGERAVIVQPGNSLWRIARNLLGEGTAFTVIYDANRAQIRDPDLIYPGQVFILPDGDGDGDGGERVPDR